MRTQFRRVRLRAASAAGAAAVAILVTGCGSASPAPVPDAVAAGQPQTSQPQPSQPQPSPARPSPPPDTRTVEQLAEPYTVSGIPVVSVHHVVARGYRPLPDGTPMTALAPQAQEAYDAMKVAAKADGVTLVVRSAYRSYATQSDLYARLSHATTAKPGESEHQTGLAADITDGVTTGAARVAASKTGQWLLANAWRYGFIVRYPEGKKEITGVTWEPWHFRWVGVEVASHFGPDNALTLEEYLGLT